MRLIHGDCTTELKKIPTETIDLTVTSPPYDNLRTYNGNNTLWNDQTWKRCISELFRITKHGGVVVWIVADATVNGSETATSFKQALWALQCGFKLHDTMIWDRGCFTSPCTTRYGASFEYMFVFSKSTPKKVTLIADRRTKHAGKPISATIRRPDGTQKRISNGQTMRREYGQRFNIWRVPPCLSNKERTEHPAQFSEQLVTDHLISWSSRGDTVLDPFMGSGTTGAIAKQLDRKFIGIELDPNYFDIAKTRIANTPSPIDVQATPTAAVF